MKKLSTVLAFTLLLGSFAYAITEAPPQTGSSQKSEEISTPIDDDKCLNDDDCPGYDTCEAQRCRTRTNWGDYCTSNLDCEFMVEQCVSHQCISHRGKDCNFSSDCGYRQECSFGECVNEED